MSFSCRSFLPLALWSLVFHNILCPNSVSGTLIHLRALPGLSEATLFSRAPGDSSSGSTPLNNLHNTQYVANVTIGNNDFPVIVDTGSSDLWLTGNVTGSKDTGLNLGLAYAIGNANGTIHTADLSFGGHSIDDQAFLYVANTSSFSSNLPKQGIYGLIGLGPNSGSLIREKLQSDSGNAPMDQIFKSATNLKRYITFLLSRRGDPTPGTNATLTIGEIVPGLEKISAQPQVPVVLLKEDDKISQHWTIQLDKEGIFGPDGKVIKKSSIVKNNGGQLHAVVDSGFTFTQVPRAVSDAIYGRVQGAVYDEKNTLWTIPCGQELNITLSIGGVRYPVHPLDSSSSDFNLKDAKGNPICVGTFQPITSAFSITGQFDIILGMSFLRNAYALHNFGSFLNDTNAAGASPPYVQLLSTTDTNEAHADFVKTRLNGVDSTGSSQYALLDKGQKSPVPLDERIQHTEQKALRYRTAIISTCIGFVVLIGGFFLWRHIKKRKQRLESEKALGGGIRYTPPNNSGPQTPSPAKTGGLYGYDLDTSREPVYLQSLNSNQQNNGHENGYGAVKEGYHPYQPDYYPGR